MFFILHRNKIFHVMNKYEHSVEDAYLRRHYGNKLYVFIIPYMGKKNRIGLYTHVLLNEPPDTVWYRRVRPCLYGILHVEQKDWSNHNGQRVIYIQNQE